MRLGEKALVAALVATAVSGLAVPAAQADPAGTNDFSCRPSAAHPRPVVMLEGLGGNSEAWAYMAPPLHDAGYCLFTMNYGIDPRIAWFPVVPEGTISMKQSSGELAGFVNRVLAATGAKRVDIVGHSEGTVMPRWYLEHRGGARKVRRFVALTPLWRGSKVGGIPMLRDSLAPYGLSQPLVNLAASLCTACTEVLSGSDYLNKLNADGEAVPGIKHTNIMTSHDELVQPYTSGKMRDGGKNIVIQDICPNDVSEHIAVAFDPVVLQMIMNALKPATAKPVRC
ncbi:MAG: triacylglycerol lipase [Thermoleophilaceae bacterium]|jgi:pimeloyl-ACP methyl ester carboxylesterase|nr:triacylglycerol lipase [Thermoleophilaceae bacterium]